MSHLPWAPLNLGVFLIILGTLMLTSILGVSGLNPLQALPLVFAIFGIWLAVLSVIMPAPTAAYAMPRSMILGWGALLTGLGVLWFVGFYAGALLSVVFSVILILAGVGAVGYSMMRSQAKKGSPSVA